MPILYDGKTIDDLWSRCMKGSTDEFMIFHDRHFTFITYFFLQLLHFIFTLIPHSVCMINGERRLLHCKEKSGPKF